MALKTNYKDDVFTGKRKYRITNNDDGTVSLDDVTVYTQQGDIFGAADINAINKEIISTTKVVTIQPEEWQEGIYTLNDPLITATSNQEWMPPLNVSKEALEILQSANIIDYSQSTGQAQIKCLGDIPAVAVTFRVCFRGDK